jgi:hypothetical protein
LAGLGLVTGCHRNVKAEFERPPASASIPETTPDVAEDEPEIQTAVVEQETVAAEVAPPVEQKDPPPPRARPRPAPPPDPEPPPPPRPQLPADQPDAEEPTSIADKLDRTVDLFSVVRDRPLTVEQREQVEAAQAFVAQARAALEEGDVVRAMVLGDKGFLLAEDVERASR